MGGIAQPQPVLQQPQELRRQVAHLRRELHLLLALEGRVRHQVLGHDHHRLHPHRAVLRPAEAQHVHGRGDVGQRAAEVSGGVGEPGAIGVQPQPLRPAELAQGPQLLQRVAGAALGHLGDRDRPGLRPVHVAPVTQPARDQGGCQLPVRGGHRQQLAAQHPLGRPALVHVEVRALREDHRLVGAQEEADPEHVRRGPVEDEEDTAQGPEQFLDRGTGLLGPRVVAVAGGIARVGARHHAQDRLVSARMVVTGEALACGHQQLPGDGGRAAAAVATAAVVQLPRAAAMLSRSRQVTPSARPAASIAMGRVLVSVIPGATLTSRKKTCPPEMIRSVRDRSRRPSDR